MISSSSTVSLSGRRRLSPPRGAGWEPVMPCCRVFTELRRVTTVQHCPLVRATGGRGRGCPTTHKRQGNTLKTTRHTTANRSYNRRTLCRGIGHPWGALGLLCRKEDIAGPEKVAETTWL